MRQASWWSWEETGWIMAVIFIIVVAVVGIGLGAHSQVAQRDQRRKKIRKLEKKNAVLQERIKWLRAKRP